MKHTYKKMASGGSVKKEKGYTAKERKGLQSLIEELADPYAGDVTGGSSVTSVKKSQKRMPGGGLVSGPGSSQRTQPSSTSGRSGGRAPGGTVSKAYSGVSGAAGAAKGAYGAAKGTTRYAAGGIVGRPARSYKDMKAGAGSGVGRIQKTKIARGR